MLYYKTISGQTVISDCRTILTDEGYWISNPDAETIAANGWLPYTPPPTPPATEPTNSEIVDAVKKMLANSVESLTDEEALAVAALYPTWASKIGEQVTTGERYWYNEKLYKVLQNHTVQQEWTPDTAVSLYVEVSIEEIPEWVQPVGAQDAYRLDAKVKHNGHTWQSNIDYNTYEPGVYGWTQLD